MKRIILIGLVMALTLSLFSGCTADDKNPSSSAGSQTNPINEKDLEIGKEYAKDALDQYSDMSAEEKAKIKDAIDSVSVNWPADKDASGEEFIAYSYIEGIVSIFEMGSEYDKAGLTIAAEYPYGTAAASISAMRYAVDCLLEIKGAAPTQDERLRDWDEIASLGWASHYPYIFEGIVLEAGGDKAAAMSCYEKAALNPAISVDDHLLRYIIRLETDQLQSLRIALTEIEDMIFEAYTVQPAAIPRSEYNFSADYLREQCAAIIEQLEADETAEASEEEDFLDESTTNSIADVLRYYNAILSLEPFNGNNYAALTSLYIYVEEPEAAIRWLNEGLFIDPECEALNALREAMEGVLGQ